MSQDVLATTVAVPPLDEIQPVIDLGDIDQDNPAAYAPLSVNFPDEIPPPAQPLLMNAEIPPGLEPRSSRWGVLGAGLLVLLVAAAGFIHLTGESDDPWENLVAFWNEVFGDSEPELESMPVEPTREPVIDNKAAETPTPVMPTDVGLPDLSNPYWLLPNEMMEKTAMNGTWGQSQKETWLRGLNHQYTWQRLKTIQDIRRSRMQGSEVALYEALNQKKFWARMEAAFALAEFGFALDLETVEKALGDTRPSLVKNYFKRFIKKSTEGEMFVLRQAIRVVEAPARLHILMAAARNRNQLNELYLAAAEHDPSPTVQTWLKPYLATYPLSQDTRDKFLAVARDSTAADEPGEKNAETQGAKPAEKPYLLEEKTPVNDAKGDTTQVVIDSITSFDSSAVEDAQVEEVEGIEEPPPEVETMKDDPTDGFLDIGGRTAEEPVKVETVPAGGVGGGGE